MKYFMVFILCASYCNSYFCYDGKFEFICNFIATQSPEVFYNEKEALPMSAQEWYLLCVDNELPIASDQKDLLDNKIEYIRKIRATYKRYNDLNISPRILDIKMYLYEKGIVEQLKV